MSYLSERIEELEKRLGDLHEFENNLTKERESLLERLKDIDRLQASRFKEKMVIWHELSILNDVSFHVIEKGEPK